MIPLIPIWLALKGATGTVLGLWNALPGAVKAMILIALAGLIGFWQGGAAADRRCVERIAASIEAAVMKDKRVSAEAKVRAEVQAAEARGREAAIEEKVKGYVEELAKRTEAACIAGADADRWNDGLGVSDQPVQPARTKPAANGARRPVSRAVPQGKVQ